MKWQKVRIGQVLSSINPKMSICFKQNIIDHQVLVGLKQLLIVFIFTQNEHLSCTSSPPIFPIKT